MSGDPRPGSVRDLASGRRHGVGGRNFAPRALDRVVLATSNRGKLADFQLLCAGTGIELVLPADVGVRFDVEETGTSFLDNALLKARAVAAVAALPTLADDSGLEVYALGGEPGIFSARYAGPQCDDHANNLKLIEKLRGVADRRAAFVCALALVLPARWRDATQSPATRAAIAQDATQGALEIVAHGRCEGLVIDEERGRNGFGYDAVFYREDLGCTFGEASAAEKNARSHRGAAVRALCDELEQRELIGRR